MMIKNLTMLCLGVLLLGACTKEPDLMPSEAGSGKLVSSRFVLQREIPGQIETRAVDENAVNNLWVVQCVGGNVSGTPTYLSSNINLNDVAVTLAASNGTVYFFVNTNNDALLTGVTTEAAVQALSQTFTYNATTTLSLPMFGQWTGTPVDGIITTPVSIYRAVTKVTFNLSSSLPAQPEMKLSKVQLKRVPTKILLARSQEALETGTYPAAVADDFTDLTADYDNSTGEVLTSTKTFTWYFPENHRGTGSALSQKNKTATTAASGQGDYCTYVEITFENDVIGTYTYRIWLGGNNYNDYNLQRNNHYTVSTRILGFSTTDTRVTLDAIGGVYAGPFGGTIEGNVSTGYKFSKLLYVDTEDAEAVKSGYLGTLDLFNGKANTWTINKVGTLPDAPASLTSYPAANFCFKRNKNYGSITTSTDKQYKWFLPAVHQLSIVHIFNNLTSIKTAWWTSTQVDRETTVYYVRQDGLGSYGGSYSAATLPVRCVRELAETNAYTPLVYKEGSTYILDLGPGTGCPQEATTTVTKVPTGTPSNTTMLPNNGLTGSVNATCFRKLEVASTGTTQHTWADANTVCKNKGVKWRLPTQKEMYLINIFRTQFVALGLTDLTSTNYQSWCLTETSNSGAYSWMKTNSQATDDSKTNTQTALCVREML